MTAAARWLLPVPPVTPVPLLFACLCPVDPCSVPTQFIMATTYTISDLAKEFDLTTRAMRFYEDMGLLQPQRIGPGGRNRVYTARDRTRLKLTLRAKRLGLSLVEAKEIIDSYDSPRDTAPQLKKFLAVLTEHRKKLEAQMLDLQANLDEIRTHEKEAKALLDKAAKAKDNTKTKNSQA
jgi:DNA-binding transcriptional MerR regulator